jgi:uncharacterized protein (UPF0297 family)
MVVQFNLDSETENKISETLYEVISKLSESSKEFDTDLKNLKSIAEDSGMDIILYNKKNIRKNYLSSLGNGFYTINVKNNNLYNVLYFILVSSNEFVVEKLDKETDEEIRKGSFSRFDYLLRKLIVMEYNKKPILTAIYNQLKTEGYPEESINLVAFMLISILLNINIVVLQKDSLNTLLPFSKSKTTNLSPICLPNYVGTYRKYIFLEYLGNEKYKPIVKCELAKDKEVIYITKKFNKIPDFILNKIKQKCKINPYLDTYETKKYQV